MHRHMRGPRFDKARQIEIRTLDHQMNVEWQRRLTPDRLHELRTEADVVDEMPVHHVQVQPVRPGVLGAKHLVA